MSNTNPDQQTIEQIVEERVKQKLRDIAFEETTNLEVQFALVETNTMLDAIKLAQGEHERKIKSLSWFLLANILTTIALLIIGLCLQKAF